jgi:hypothetical protein
MVLLLIPIEIEGDDLLCRYQLKDKDLLHEKSN